MTGEMSFVKTSVLYITDSDKSKSLLQGKEVRPTKFNVKDYSVVMRKWDNMTEKKKRK